jgi:hypothetical protein
VCDICAEHSCAQWSCSKRLLAKQSVFTNILVASSSATPRRRTLQAGFRRLPSWLEASPAFFAYPEVLLLWGWGGDLYILYRFLLILVRNPSLVAVLGFRFVLLHGTIKFNTAVNRAKVLVNFDLKFLWVVLPPFRGGDSP